MNITPELVTKLLKTVDAGLVYGLGNPEPGKMCVEAAVCYALGEEHGDRPSCVADAVRTIKIRLNDASWSSNEARAKGMRKIAVAQLGSRGTVDETQFVQYMAPRVIGEILPIAFRAVAERFGLGAEKKRLMAAALRCEKDKDRYSADAAYAVAVRTARAAAAADADEVLNKMAGIVLDALIECKSPGCEFLYLAK